MYCDVLIVMILEVQVTYITVSSVKSAMLKGQRYNVGCQFAMEIKTKSHPYILVLRTRARSHLIVSSSAFVHNHWEAGGIMSMSADWEAGGSMFMSADWEVGGSVPVVLVWEANWLV